MISREPAVEIDSISHPRARRFHPLPLARLVLLVLLITFSVSAPARGLAVKAMSLDEIVSHSSQVIRGTVSTIQNAQHGGTVSTVYTITVSERLAGRGGGTVILRVPGGRADGLVLTVPGVPRFVLGEEVLLFVVRYRGHDMVVGHFLGA